MSFTPIKNLKKFSNKLQLKVSLRLSTKWKSMLQIKSRQHLTLKINSGSTNLDYHGLLMETETLNSFINMHVLEQQLSD
ncbi:hypothetical protein BVC80_8699g18 [Macleaya cordata]|uniref:Uncharacterized protein n=1 Tax=Macleaya cordata TaxID=56857 RepID=A0A200Q0R3_MACCD|nr:hypothetical protein BVC80_8699g18 [Macleaya cordata]